MLSHVFCDLNNIFINLINILKLRRLTMDAKEWSKMADKVAQVRATLYKVQEEHEEYDTEVYSEVAFIRRMLLLTLESIDKLAKWDDKGWMR